VVFKAKKNCFKHGNNQPGVGSGVGRGVGFFEEDLVGT
jgi:hypothetical protein